MRLYWELARRAYQRQLAYRTANIVGLITNAVFGYLRAAVMLALYAGQDTIGGYDRDDAITYLWITQACVMVIALWGWYDVEQTIRTGDVVSDLARPFNYLGYWLARDYGRALYFVLFRGGAVMLVGEISFGLRWPTSPLTWLAFGVSLALGVAISFACRFLMNLSAFWTTDARGVILIGGATITFLSGFLVPIGFFPDWARRILELLPFAGIVQIPGDIFLERLTGPAMLASMVGQVVWTVALLGVCQLAVAGATRRVLIQGG
jgi:ABC-2 type transport system permease protein